MKHFTLFSVSLTCMALSARAQQIPEAPRSEPAGLWWADFDADGKLDALALLPSGQVVLLHNQGAGVFEDMSAATGLAKVEGASFATWQDIDGDGLVDLFLGGVGGAQRLWRNAGATFQPCDCGIAHDALDLDARWIDIDDDQLPDLLAVTDAGELVYRNLGGSQFERVELPLPASDVLLAADSETLDDADRSLRERREQFRARLRLRLSSNATAPINTAGAATPAGTIPPSSGGAPLPIISCRPGIMDIATMGCVDVSSTPMLGTLYPLSTNLNVSATGNVGIGTTSPLHKLSVATANTQAVEIKSSSADGTWCDIVNTSPSGAMWRIIASGANSTSGSGNLEFRHLASQYSPLRIRGSGNVEIGPNSSSYQLSVSASHSALISLSSSSADGTPLVMTNTSAFPSVWTMTVTGTGNSEGAGKLVFTKTGTGLPFMTMLPSGDVGIGTATPTDKLDVKGSLGVDDGDSNTGTIANALHFGAGAGGEAIGSKRSVGGNFGGLDFYTASANRMAISSGGNVGIGTASPQVKLAVVGSVNVDYGATNAGSTANALHFGDQSSAEGIGSKKTAGGNQNGLDFYTFGVNRMAITNGGNVGIGTTSPTDKLEVVGGIKVDAFDQNTGTTANALRFGGGGSGEAIFSKRSAGGNQYGLDLMTLSTSRVSITIDGKVGVGRVPNSTTGNAFEVEGNASKTTATSWLANSDRRIKTDVRELDGALETLDRIRPVAFRYTDEYKAAHPSIEDKDYYNVIAQEFAEVFPDYVHATDENGILQVDTYPALIHAIAAIQELNAISEQKDARIAALEERVLAAEASARANDARIARLESTLASLATERR